MANSGYTGIRRWLMAGRFSWQGYKATYRYEEAFRQEVWALCLAVPLALWLTSDGLERVLLIGSVLLLLIVELLNSAVEAVVDRIGLEQHKLSGRAKDMGSGAVLLAVINAVLVWSLIAYRAFT